MVSMASLFIGMTDLFGSLEKSKRYRLDSLTANLTKGPFTQVLVIQVKTCPTLKISVLKPDLVRTKINVIKPENDKS